MTDPKTIAVPMPILTPRLRLEVVDPKYATERTQAVIESISDIEKWSVWVHKPGAVSEEEIQKWMQQAALDFLDRKNMFVHAFDAVTGRLVGGAGLEPINWQIPSLSISYWVRSSCANKGYATEMTRALVRYSFAVLHVNRISIFCDVNNAASKRVIEKSGFRFECLAKNDAVDVHGKVTSSYRYAITDPADVPDIEISWGHK